MGMIPYPDKKKLNAIAMKMICLVMKIFVAFLMVNPRIKMLWHIKTIRTAKLALKFINIKSHVFDKALQMHRSSSSRPSLGLDTTDRKGREPKTTSSMLR